MTTSIDLSDHVLVVVTAVNCGACIQLMSGIHHSMVEEVDEVIEVMDVEFSSINTASLKLTGIHKRLYEAGYVSFFPSFILCGRGGVYGDSEIQGVYMPPEMVLEVIRSHTGVDAANIIIDWIHDVMPVNRKVEVVRTVGSGYSGNKMTAWRR